MRRERRLNTCGAPLARQPVSIVRSAGISLASTQSSKRTASQFAIKQQRALRAVGVELLGGVPNRLDHGLDVLAKTLGRLANQQVRQPRRLGMRRLEATSTTSPLPLLLPLQPMDALTRAF
jgi:hypothetical protein